MCPPFGKTVGRWRCRFESGRGHGRNRWGEQSAGAVSGATTENPQLGRDSGWFPGEERRTFRSSEWVRLPSRTLRAQNRAPVRGESQWARFQSRVVGGGVMGDRQLRQQEAETRARLEQQRIATAREAQRQADERNRRNGRYVGDR